MLNIKENERIFIQENIDNANTLLQSDNVNDILCALDNWLTLNGFDDDYDLTEKGRIAQRIYDSIYENN